MVVALEIFPGCLCAAVEMDSSELLPLLRSEEWGQSEVRTYTIVLPSELMRTLLHY